MRRAGSGSRPSARRCSTPSWRTSQRDLGSYGLNHGSESRLTVIHLQDLQEKVGIPRSGFPSGFDASLGFVGAQETEDEAADDGHVLGAVAGAIAGEVVLEFDVEQPVHAFHPPQCPRAPAASRSMSSGAEEM